MEKRVRHFHLEEEQPQAQPIQYNDQSVQMFYQQQLYQQQLYAQHQLHLLQHQPTLPLYQPPPPQNYFQPMPQHNYLVPNRPPRNYSPPQQKLIMQIQPRQPQPTQNKKSPQAQQSILEKISNTSTQRFITESQHQRISSLFKEKEKKKVCHYDSQGRLTKIFHWDIQRTLGQGGFGTVFLGRSGVSGPFQEVAVKQIQAGEYDQHFLDNEIQIQYKFSGNEYIVSLIKAFKYKQHYLLVMEYLPHNLSQFISRRQPSLQTRLALFKQVLMGVQVMHQNGFIHADLKPENILLDSQAKVKLCDFSLAQKLDVNGRVVSTHKFGSQEYMHPALFQHSAQAVYSTSNDYWALGVILHELMLDSHPYHNLLKTKQYSLIRDYQPSQHHYYSSLVHQTLFSHTVFPILGVLLNRSHPPDTLQKCLVYITTPTHPLRTQPRQRRAMGRTKEETRWEWVVVLVLLVLWCCWP